MYFLLDGDRLILLLNGGDKATQDADIKAAHDIAHHWRRTQGAQQCTPTPRRSPPSTRRTP